MVVPFQTLLPPGVDTPRWVRRVGDGGAEEGQNRVAHQPGQRALVTINRRYQVLEGPVHDLGPLFRVQLLCGGGGTGHVAEQHRDHPAFALDTTAGPGRLQLLQQFSWNILFQLGADRRRLGSLAQLMAAV